MLQMLRVSIGNEDDTHPTVHLHRAQRYQVLLPETIYPGLKHMCPALGLLLEMPSWCCTRAWDVGATARQIGWKRWSCFMASACPSHPCGSSMAACCAAAEGLMWWAAADAAGHRGPLWTQPGSSAGGPGCTPRWQPAHQPLLIRHVYVLFSCRRVDVVGCCRCCRSTWAVLAAARLEGLAVLSDVSLRINP